jgi:hypothetical protein
LVGVKDFDKISFVHVGEATIAKVSKARSVESVKNQSSIFIFGLFEAVHSLQLMFQEPATEVMCRIIDLHNEIMTLVVFTVIVVIAMTVKIVELFGENNRSTIRSGFYHHTATEII